MNKLLENFCLFFRPTIVSVDEGDGLFDQTVETHLKILFGKTYVISVKRYDAPPKHYNCRSIVAPIMENDLK